MVRSDTAIGMLCRFHLRLKASVDLLSKSTVQVPGSIGVTEENNICDTYSCANIRKRNQLDRDIVALLLTWETPVPCKFKPGVRFISQGDNTPCEAYYISKISDTPATRRVS